MNKSVISKFALSGVMASMVLVGDLAVAGDHSLSANIAMTTDYRFRGVSQTDGGPAIQGGFDYAHEPTGIYAGVWGSNVDSSDDGYAAASMELDVYIGWAKSWDAFSLDLSALRYNYPNTDVSDNNTNEFALNLGYDFGMASVSGTATYSPDWYGTDSYNYYALGMEIPLPNDFSLYGNYGWNKFDDSSADYNDWSIGVAVEYGGFGFDLAYVDTDIDGDCDDVSVWKCDSTAVFTVSKSFE
jgi:uncharacterized protein (TIGR02001 family)